MVAYRLALLSAAALSTFGFDVASGAFLGRYDRRLVPRADGPNQDASGAVAAIQARGPPARPNTSNTSAAPTTTTTSGEATAASFDLGAGSPSFSTAVGGGGLIQLISSSSSIPSTATSTTDYIDPNDYGTSGTLTTQSTSVPVRTSAPTRFSVGANTATAGGPPPAETTTLTTSTRTKPPHLPTLPAVPASLTLEQVPNSPASEVGSATVVVVMANGTETTKTTVRTTAPVRKTTADVVNKVSQSMDIGISTGVSTETEAISTTEIPPSRPPATSTPYANLTATITSLSSQSVSYCQASDSDKPATSYSVIYTSTITWTKDPDEYTPPYPPMTTPVSCVEGLSPQRLTASGCNGDTEACSTTEAGWAPITITHAASKHGTIVLITTDKNPSVVYSSISTPDYGVTRGGSGPQDLHNSATAVDPIITPGYSSDAPTKGAAVSPTTPPITVAVQPSGVVVNGKTYTDNPASPSQTVVIDHETLTINPSQIIGAGVSVDRPALTGGVFASQPTSTSIGGLDVQVSSSLAVLDGTTFTLGQTPVTTTIKGQAVTLGPSGVVVGTETIPVTSVPTPSQIVIAGGELATAIGQSVFVVHGTTVTYGPSSSGIVTVVGGDSITLGPMGVTIHGTTFGGPNAQSTDTDYEIVGGATITELGASLVVIDGTTYTVGPGTGTTITVIKGQTITIAPTGVTVSTVTLTYPFGPTTTITPGGTATPTTPGETGAAASPTPSKDAALQAVAQPNTWSLLCIAIGVVVLGI
ncbi:hypothetical protein GQ53DRAFT_744852 [Thozetella sp. PMI_491]|nr:hypothetical protein GQ53DRAFT_744852 [Thozetella sp. PMI_491]